MTHYRRTQISWPAVIPLVLVMRGHPPFVVVRTDEGFVYAELRQALDRSR